MQRKDANTAGPSARVRTPRDAKGIAALKILEKTSTSVYQSRIPPKSAVNARHCHFLKASRDVKRIDRHAWESRVGEMLRVVERHRFDRVNALYNALARVNRLLADARAREKNLQEMTVELEKTSTYLQTLMDSMADILIATDPAGVITEANPAAVRISGFAREELIGRNFTVFFSEPHSAEDCIRSVVADGEISDLDLSLVHKEKRVIPIMVNGTVLMDEQGGVAGVLINARDVSELKRAQESRELYARELARANEDLEEFASLASHELKEPLKKVTAHAETLAERYAEMFDDQARQDLLFLVAQTVHMQALIKAVLDYARVDTGEAVLQPADCEKVLDQALVNLTGAMEESPVEIMRDPLPTVRGDPEQLIRLFQNLVGNALKYFDPAKPDPFVHISAKRIEDGDIRLPQSVSVMGWLFKVADNGPGVDEEFQQDIFKMFVRLYSAEEYPGEGMGLAISRRIVRRHGGEIWVVSTAGVGSTFYFTIPDRS